MSRKILLGAAASERIPNAYLFTGSSQPALLAEALTFAQELNCGSKKAPEGTACGSCENCRKIAKNLHPDVLSISSSGKSIKIDEMRQVTQFVKYGPGSAKWKVIVIDGADQMTEEAANSFLKTLEEPHDNVLFILTTVREQNILKTIVSRSQKIPFQQESGAPDERISSITEKLLALDKMGIPEVLSLSDELSYEDDLEGTLNCVLYDYGNKTGMENKKKFLAAKAIFNAVRALERRGNKKLTLDNMLLSLKEAMEN